MGPTWPNGPHKAAMAGHVGTRAAHACVLACARARGLPGNDACGWPAEATRPQRPRTPACLRAGRPLTDYVGVE